MSQIPLILASKSPRRKSLLKQIGLTFQVVPSRYHEDFNLKLSPGKLVEHFAKQKALDISIHYPDHLIIGADTIVVFKNQILGKPSNKRESKIMLSKLSGKKHMVITGVCLLLKNNNICDVFREKTMVTFQKFTKKEINHYIEHYHPFDKAGSYGIQDWFSVCVKKIDGCFYNVVGFPLSAFYQKYKQINMDF